MASTLHLLHSIFYALPSALMLMELQTGRVSFADFDEFFRKQPLRPRQRAGKEVPYDPRSETVVSPVRRYGVW